MKVFISSVIRGYEAYRDAAADAVRELGHEPLRAEDYPSAPDAPQRVCLQGVRDSDVFVLLMGARYGYVAPSGLSATHEEYEEAKERRPVLAFIEQGVDLEPKQREFVAEVQSYDSGHYTSAFSDPTSLRAAVVRALHRHEVSSASGKVDASEMLDRASKLAPQPQGGSASASLFLCVAGGPVQQALRPAEIEDSELHMGILQEALFGDPAVFDVAHGNSFEVRSGVLTISQKDASILLDEQGSVRILLPARKPTHGRSWSEPMALIEEDVKATLERMLRFSAQLLNRIDPVHRFSDVAVAAGLSGGAYLGWQTRDEASKSGGSYVMGRGRQTNVVSLSPPSRKRQVLLMETAQLAEDLVALLKREIKE